MAHTISAKKRIRQGESRALRNKARTSRIRTFVRKVEEAVRTGDKKSAEAAFQAMMPEMHKGVSKGLLHKNTAARKLSRLSARIKSL
jgi:small subunit ribosomal protein S20